MTAFTEMQVCAIFYKNNVNEDKEYLDSQVNALFHTDIAFNQQDCMHIYASLASNKTVCPPGIAGNCNIPTEIGHVRPGGLIKYFRILFEAAIRAHKNIINIDDAAKLELYLELERTYSTILLMIDRSRNASNQNISQHVNRVYDMIMSLSDGQVLCYEAGHVNHAIYINIRKPEDCNYITFTISNLGDGYNYTDGHLFFPASPGSTINVVYLRTVCFSSSDEYDIKQYLFNLAYYAARKREEATLKAIYPPYDDRQKAVDSQFLKFEIEQTTGNCVIKNKLFALRDVIFSDNIYSSIFISIMEVALDNIAFFNAPLPSRSDFSSSIIGSQISLHSNSSISDNSTLLGNACVTKAMIEEKPGLLFLCLIGGALSGAMFGLAASNNDRDAKRNVVISGLIGAAAGGLFSSTALKEQNTVNARIPLSEKSSHCYSCPPRAFP